MGEFMKELMLPLGVCALGLIGYVVHDYNHSPHSPPTPALCRPDSEVVTKNTEDHICPPGTFVETTQLGPLAEDDKRMQVLITCQCPKTETVSANNTPPTKQPESIEQVRNDIERLSQSFANINTLASNKTITVQGVSGKVSLPIPAETK